MVGLVIFSLSERPLMLSFKPSLLGAACLGLVLTACSPSEPAPQADPQASASEAASSARGFTADKFTYANYTQVRVTHLDLDLDVDFEAKVLRGTATLDFERIDRAAKELVLDTKGLTILLSLIHI